MLRIDDKEIYMKRIHELRIDERFYDVENHEKENTYSIKFMIYLSFKDIIDNYFQDVLMGYFDGKVMNLRVEE